MVTRIKPICTSALLAGIFLWMQGATAASGNYYVPFTLQLGATSGSQGLWLADTSHPGSAASSITGQALDGVSGSNVAVLNTWKYSTSSPEARSVTPVLMVYGQSGRLLSYALSGHGTPQPLSSGRYTALCSLTALTPQPYTGSGSAYVEAVVVAGSGDCASGNGVQTWIIPGNANASAAPLVEPATWQVLGALTDPSNGNLSNWIVWTGTEVDIYRANFTGAITAISTLPAGPAPTLIGHLSGAAFLAYSSSTGGMVTDQLFHVLATGASHIYTHIYAASSPCTGLAKGAVMDAANGLLAFAEPTDTGYAVLTAPVAGGIPTEIYADASGGYCGTVAGDGVSAFHVTLYELQLAGLHRAIGVKESGPVGQAPVVLAGDANTDASPHYTIGGHVWIDLTTFPGSGGTGSPQYSEVVMDGDGTLVASYPGAQVVGEHWAGFYPDGRNSGIDRDLLYLFYPAGGAGACSGGALLAYNTSTFAQTAIAGMPADSCAPWAYGWQSAGLGSITRSSGNAAVALDPAGGQLYQLTSPQSQGVYTNLLATARFPSY